MKKHSKNRALGRGALATLITILGVVLVVLINMVAAELADRFPLSMDLTSNSAFTLSPETKEYLQSVHKPVSITVLMDYETFASRNAYYQQAAELLTSVGQANPMIALRFVDIIKNPGYAAQYPDLSLTHNNILIECQGRTYVIKISDLFNTQVDSSSYQTYITSSKVEQALASAILTVTNEEALQVTILQGHNESDISDFAALLDINGFETQTCTLMTDELNPEAGIAIFAAPSRDMTETESAKLDAWLDNGGRLGKTLLYISSVSQPEDMPILEAFLADWGIRIAPGVVFETNASKRFQQNYFMVLADYAEEVYSREAVSQHLPFGIANARPMEILFKEKGFIEVAALLEFSKDAGVMPVDATADWQPIDPSGPFPAMILSRRAVYEQTTALLSSVLAVGSPTVMDPYFTANSSFSNAKYLLHLFSSLAGRQQAFSVQSKTIERAPLGLTTAAQLYTLLAIFTVALPLAVMLCGFVVWLRRRHR